MIFRRVRVMLFPELARFESTNQQRDAWKRAELAVVRRPAYWISAIIILLVFTWIVFSLRSWGVPMSMRGAIRGTLLILVVLAAMALGWTFRKTIRHSLRKQLVDRGVPICINCGYDLRASKERCPECGTVRQRNGTLGTMTNAHDEPNPT